MKLGLRVGGCVTERNYPKNRVMEEKMFNEDYLRGIKFLLEKAKEQGINVRKCQWIPHVSEMLSEHNLCYKFWYNVVKQGNLNRVFLCENWYDVMYVSETWLFLWATTEEGVDFWRNHLWEMLGLDMYNDIFAFPDILKERKLYQI